MADGAAALAAPAAAPFVLGLIADIQFADCEDGTSFDGSEQRRYRSSLAHARAAALDFAASGCTAVVQLGDLLDGKNSKLPSGASATACATALAALASPSYALYHVRGNHENYNFSVAQQKQLLPLPPAAQPFPDPELFYYSAQPHPRWRLLVLDAFDVSLSRPRGSPGFLEAQRLLRAHNPNPCAWGEEGAPPGSFFEGIKGTPAARYVPFNGGLGQAQLAWLRAALASARQEGHRVLVFCHVPLNPAALCLHEPTVFSTLLFNHEEALAALAGAGDVVAGVFAGHNHTGSFGRDGAGIPHWTLPSPLIFAAGSHLVVEAHGDRLQLRGVGECANLMHPSLLRGEAGAAAGGSFSLAAPAALAASA